MLRRLWEISTNKLYGSGFPRFQFSFDETIEMNVAFPAFYLIASWSSLPTVSRSRFSIFVESLPSNVASFFNELD